jgi:endonuclease YncB( thermonuclease family)
MKTLLPFILAWTLWMSSCSNQEQMSDSKISKASNIICAKFTDILGELCEKDQYWMKYFLKLSSSTRHGTLEEITRYRVEEIIKITHDIAEHLEFIGSFKIIDVYDADTIHIIMDWKKRSLRLIGANSPELKERRKSSGSYLDANSTYRGIHFWKQISECYSQQAKNFTSQQVLWESVELYQDKVKTIKNHKNTDKYSRPLVYVFHNGVHINFELVRLWFARENGYNEGYFYERDFEKAQEEAMSENRWLWQECNYTPVKEKWNTKRHYPLPQ